MGQFLDYIASIISGRAESDDKQKANTSHHVTFADNSFTQAFNRSSNEQAAKLASLRQSNRKTIGTYQFIIFLVCLIHFSLVTWPKLKSETFSITEPEGWQLVTLSLVPLVVQIGSICAMNELNKPLPDGTKLTSKNSGLELDNNDFIHSLKVIILLTAMCQLSAVFSDQLLWSLVMIVSTNESYFSIF